MLAPALSAYAQQPPNKTLAGLRVPEGFDVTLFASEPLVNNPTAIDVDAQGRVWVAEGVNYRHSIHGSQVAPPDPQADRIKVLEDTDGDGRADKMTVFADGLLVPMSVAVAGGKVYVGESPYLWVLEDTDGDGRADKKEALLEGFRGRDHDHGIHGLVLGPDGRLYFTVGDEGMDVTDRAGNRVAPLAGAMLRVDLDGTGLTLLADNFRNPYELAVDSWGNVFCSDNDTDGLRSTRICWVLEGGSYGWKGPASPTGHHWREDLPGYVPKILATGAGSPCGILVYEGDLLPPKFRGALIHADAGPREVRAYHLRPSGAGYAAEPEVIVSSDDPWFRPVDVAAHPDGSLFIADWYDAGVGGHRYSDVDTGRIYRLAPKDSKPAQAPKVDLESLDGLVASLQSPAPAVRFLAIGRFLDRGEKAVGTLVDLAEREQGRKKARALALLARLPDGRAEVRRFAADPDAATRAQVVRLLREQADENDRSRILLLADDPDAPVRREALLALRDVPTTEAEDALRQLVARYDGADRFYLAALGLALRGREPEFLTSLLGPPEDHARLAASVELAWELREPASIAFVGEVLGTSQDDALKRRCLEALRNISDPAASLPVASVLRTTTDDPSLARLALDCLAYNLAGAWKDRTSESEVAVQESIALGLRTPELTSAAIDAIGRGRMSAFAPELTEIAGDASRESEQRIAAVGGLAELRAVDAVGALRRLVDADRIDPDDPKLDPHAPADPLAIESLRALFAIDAQAGEWQGRQLIADRRSPNALRREAVRLVGRDPAGSGYLLELAETQQLPAELKGEATAVVHRQRDAEIKSRADALLPLPKSAAGRALPPIAGLALRDGDAARGRALFFRKDQQGAVCARCHRVQGEGETIGPDLSEIGVKLARAALFDSILNPSAGIAHEYRPYVIALANGQILTGLVAERSSERVVLKTAEGQQIVVRTEEIDEEVAQDVSLMPEDLSTTLTETELVDVVAFLETLRQPAPESTD
jgi:putative membrane-bound dehydrogenase-like protein